MESKCMKVLGFGSSIGNVATVATKVVLYRVIVRGIGTNVKLEFVCKSSFSLTRKTQGVSD